MRTALVILSVVLGACSGGARVNQVVMGDAIEGVDSGGEATNALIDAEIVVSVSVPPEGLLLANSSDGVSHYESIPNANTDLQGAEREAYFTSLYEGLDESQGTNFVIQVVDAEAILVIALERHLRRHFRSARLVLSRDLALSEMGHFVVSAAGSADMLFTKSATIALLTESGPTELPPFEGHGERRSGRHLGWAIPVVLVGGLIIGSLIATPILGAIVRRHVRESWAEAFDRAASQWAAAVADAWRSQNGFPQAQQTVAESPAVVAPPPIVATPSAPVACDESTPCGAGFICHEAFCLSACNPACAANEVCLDGGACVSACNPPCQGGTVCTAQRECAAP